MSGVAVNQFPELAPLNKISSSFGKEKIDLKDLISWFKDENSLGEFLALYHKIKNPKTKKALNTFLDKKMGKQLRLLLQFGQIGKLEITFYKGDFYLKIGDLGYSIKNRKVLYFEKRKGIILKPHDKDYKAKKDSFAEDLSKVIGDQNFDTQYKDKINPQTTNNYAKAILSQLVKDLILLSELPKMPYFPLLEVSLPKSKIMAQTLNSFPPLSGKIIAKVDFKDPSFTFKNMKKQGEARIKEINLQLYEVSPYYHPQLGGDLHGVDGGIAQAFEWNPQNRPDISSVTHFVYYAYVKGKKPLDIFVEFFDYDPGTAGGKDNFSSNLNKDLTHEQILELSNEEINGITYQATIYDGFEYRIFGSDDFKKVMRFEPGYIYRVLVPFSKEIVENPNYYMNTGYGDYEFNINPQELERVQFVIHASPKDQSLKAIPACNKMQFIDYKTDSTVFNGDPTDISYPYNVTSNLLGLGEEFLFIEDPENQGKLIIQKISISD